MLCNTNYFTTKSTQRVQTSNRLPYLNFIERHISRQKYFSQIAQTGEDILKHSKVLQVENFHYDTFDLEFCTGILTLTSQKKVIVTSDIWHKYQTFMPNFIKIGLILIEKSLLPPR